jgi:citrate lyase synthetase
VANLIKANAEDGQKIFKLVQTTIQQIYPSYYPLEVVQFFCYHHKLEAIQHDIQKKNVWILIENEDIIGTGSCAGNNLMRLFVLPNYQGKGHGAMILDNLEKEIGQNFDHVILDASLASAKIYEKRGYQTIKHEQILVSNTAILTYEVMKKSLNE